MAQCSKLWVAVIISACMLFSGIARADQDVSKKQFIKDNIEKIRTCTNARICSKTAWDLAILLRYEISPEEIDDEVITDMVSLLDMDGVRYGTALDAIVLAFGNLGPHAKKAVPKLLQLLDKVEVCYPQDVSLADDIRNTLLKIGITPTPTKCKNIEELYDNMVPKIDVPPPPSPNKDPN
jgi:hypothetical protein